MAVFKCKMCGGNLEIEQGQTTVVCDYCATPQTLPRLEDDRRINLYERANHFRRNNEFDKAIEVYEHILNEDRTDAEAYWSLLLCKYGIEYVVDPATKRRVPTVHRTQFTSVFEDEDYKAALTYADASQRALYEQEANAINEIQKGILAISRQEKPFDVFICYKETDAEGKRTQDSVLAQDLYFNLTNEGFKVFFARITLESKLGSAYEPYIFAALNSAAVMVVVGTKAEHFNAVWVKNEWSRYLSLVKASGGKKVLIPAYRDMDAYELPSEFSHLQAQDMSKLGFMQDLMRGIKKLTHRDKEQNESEQVVVQQQTGAAIAAPLVQRAFLCLEDGEFGKARELIEQALNSDPENGDAYLCLMMADFFCKTFAELERCPKLVMYNKHYPKIMRFGGEKLKAQIEGIVNATVQVRMFVENRLRKTTQIAPVFNADLWQYIRRDENGLIVYDSPANANLWQYITIDENGLIVHDCPANADLRRYNIRIDENGLIVYDCPLLKEITILATTQIIDEYSFKDVRHIECVKIENGVGSIGNHAFQDCSALQEIVIPESVQSIGKFAFDGCSALKKVVIPEGVWSIGDGAFDRCSALQEIVIPESVRSIGKYAFAGCSALKKVVIPEGVRSIEDEVFRGCSALQTVVIPEGVQSIRYRAFSYCSALQEVEIPASVEWVGEEAFFNCKQLRTVHLINEKTSVDDRTFDGIHPRPKIIRGEGKGCYVATAVYGSYDCPEVWTLRRYRDETLAATWYGRAFVRAYYAISPTLVKWFGKAKWFRRLWQGRLDRMVRRLNARGVENTPYQDQEW